MRKLLTTSVMLVAVGLLVAAVTPDVLLAANTISLECPVDKPIVDGDSIGVNVYIQNDDPLGGFSLGFSYNSNDIEISSISQGPALSFGGSISFLTTLKPDQNKVLAGMLNFNPALPMPSYSTPTLLFTLWFQVPNGTPAQCVNIDSTFVPPAGPFVVSPQSGGTVTPDYIDCGDADLSIAGGCSGPANTAPVVAGIPDQTIQEGGSFNPITLDNYVTDAEDAPADMSWTATSDNPDFTVSINGSRIATVSYPGGEFSGSANIVFTATDPGSLSDSDTASFTVTAVNDPPVVAGIPDQSVAYGANFSTFDLDDYVTDPDNPPSDINWTFSGNTDLSVSIDTAHVVTVSKPSPDWSGSETITFTATDPGNETGSDDATFTVASPVAHISLNSDSLFFNSYQGGPNPAAQTIIVTNSGTGDLNWNASASETWVGLSASSGTAPSGTDVSIDISTLDIGTHTAEVTITSGEADNSPQTVYLTVTIIDDVDILLEPDSLFFTAVGTNPDPQSFHISNASPSGVEFDWGAVETTPWMSLSPTSGTSPSDVTVTINADGLALGDYSAIIIVKQLTAAAGVNNDEDTVYVSLTVDQQTDVNDIGGALPQDYRLSQNFPNPFNPTTAIEFNLPKASHVTLTIYNVLGQQVKTLIDQTLGAGNKRVIWDGTDAAGRTVQSGVYFYRISADQFTQTRKMMMLK